MRSFWETLPKPFFAMAPMADVTDPAWRALVAKLGKPDVMFTEFVSADGLYHTREIQEVRDEDNPLMRDLVFTEAERPVVAQFFTAKPEMTAYAAALAAELGFDGVDINMGCPDRAIEKQGAGAALIKTPALAQELIRAAQDPVSVSSKSSYRTDLMTDGFTPLPVSVKTRIGFNRETLDEWLPALLEARPAAITLHLRTRKEMSAVPAHWEVMAQAVALRDKLAPGVLLIGNGDVRSLDDAKVKARETGADGVMIGRSMFGNPWVFDPALEHVSKPPPVCADGFWPAARSSRPQCTASTFRAPTRRLGTKTIGSTRVPRVLEHALAFPALETIDTSINAKNSHLAIKPKPGLNAKLNALVELAYAFERLSPPKNFAILKKHIKAFVTGFDGAAELRASLMEAESAAELERKITKARV